MNESSRRLAALYRKSHDLMRNIDGLQPMEAFDELLKYLFLKEAADAAEQSLPLYHPPLLQEELIPQNRKLVKDLHHRLEEHIESFRTWSSGSWQSMTFHLSDVALLSVHEIFENVDFTSIDFDTRSLALSEFFHGELRKGLGIFPTPDVVARMMVEVASPSLSSRVFDPACGTGTFLVEVMRRMNRNTPQTDVPRVWGVDKNPRMLMLSEFNLGHSKRFVFQRALADSLYQPPFSLFKEVDEGFDLHPDQPAVWCELRTRQT